MPNQAESKPEGKDGRKLQGKYHLNFRLDPEDYAVIEQHQKELGFKNCVSAIRDILQKHGLQPEEKIIDFQACEHWSAYPSHPEFVRCREKGWLRTIPTEQCIACKLYKDLQIPIMTPSRLQAYISKEKNELTDLRKEKQIELVDTNKVKRLESLVDFWKRKSEDIEALLSQKNRCIDNLGIENAALQNDNNSLRSMSPMEAHEKLHSAKATVENSMIKRVTEEKKVTEEFAQQQPQPKAPPQLILCPKTREMTVFEDVCKTCETVMECPNYNEIAMLNRVIGKR
jgi:hypothetical protein